MKNWLIISIIISAILIIVEIAAICRMHKVATQNGKTDDDVRHACRITVVVLILLLAMAWFIPAWASGAFAKDSTETAEAAKSEAESFRYYNLELQDDKIEDNNLDFGPDPYAAALASYAERDGEKATFILEYLEQEFAKRMTPGENGDPAFAAAHVAYLDATIGTRVMGSFYDEVDEEWDRAINNARNKFETDSSEWSLAVEKYQKTLEATNAKVYLVEVDGKTDTFVCNGVKYTVTDQMYMYPFTSDLRPDIIVMTQEEDDSDEDYHVLMYVLNIKGHNYVLMFKAECGFQPLNVLSIMKGIEPVKKSDIETEKGGDIVPTDKEPGEDIDTSKKGGGGSKDKDTDTKCDPSDSALTGEDAAPSGAGKGDTKDAGPDTNNGVGATESKVQAEDDSTDYSYKEYVEKVEDLAGQTGNDPTPTAEKESGVDVVVESKVSSDPIPVKTETEVKTDDGKTDNLADNVSDGDAGAPVF